MHLLFTPTSPYARKVRMLAREKGLQLREVVAPPNDPGSPVKQHNPLGKVPTLLLEDGQAIFDSRVIVQCLELLQPQPAWIPAEMHARIDVLRWEALADGVSDAAVAWMLDRRRPVERQDFGWQAHQVGKVEAGLQAAQDRLTNAPFLVGAEATLADLAMVAAVGYVQLRGVVDLTDARWMPLRTWQTRMHDRPSVADTAPPA